MKKTDISLFALIFFITRSIFNLVKTPNFIWMITLFLLDIILLIFIKKFNLKSNLLIKLIYLFLALNIINNITTFINLNYFSNISNFIIKLSLLITLYLVVENGFHSLKSTSEILFFIFIIIFVIVMSSSCFYIDKENILTYITSTKVDLNYTNFIPVLIVLVFSSIKDKDLNYRKIIMYFLISFITILIEMVVINGVVGMKMVDYYFYPSTILLKQLPYFVFNNRLDNLFSIVFLFESTITLTYLLYEIKKEKKLYLFLSLLILLIF